MSPRPVPPKPASSQAGPDLDSTAELPVLDPAAADTPAANTASVRVEAGAPDDALTTTDSWALTPAARAALGAAAAGAEERRQQESELQSRTAALREAHERLASHGKRLLQLERARDEALAAQAAAAQRAAAAEQRAAAAEQRVATAEQRAARAQQSAATLTQRVADLDQRTAQFNVELGERQSAAAQHTTRQQESARALAAVEQRAAAAGEELAQARALVSAAGARAQELQQRLEQLENDGRAQRAQEQQQREQAAARRAHTSSVMEDLHYERARAMSYLESLQTLERRRELTQELVTDLQHEGAARAAELARLMAKLAAGDEHSDVQQAELAQRTARIAQLEEQAGTLTTMLAQRDAQLRDGQQEAQGLRASVARLQAEINAGTERLRALEDHSTQRESHDTQRQEELRRLRSEIASVNAALEASRRGTLAATAQASAQQAALAQHTERSAQLEAALDAERKRATQLESELATVRHEMEEWGGVLRSAQQERSGHLASIAAAESRVRELESNLHAAEEALQRLEADVRNRGARIAELEKSNVQWREAAGEARQAATDSSLALREPGRHDEEEGFAGEPLADGATRLLIRSDEEGREVVHVLARKTSIGRTPDNDVQLDAKFISRHHAVILAGPVSTVIEDLNSTNGVQVNGRRVTRQTLHDGDQIAIGRAQYRFVVRKPPEKR